MEFSGPLISPKCTLFYGLHWNAFKRPNKWALGTWAVSSALFTISCKTITDSLWVTASSAQVETTQAHLLKHLFLLTCLIFSLWGLLWGNSSPPTYKRNEDRQWPLRGQNWWYYLKEGYYKNILWKDISWKVISAFFNLGKSDEWQLVCQPLEVLIRMNGSIWKWELHDQFNSCPFFCSWLKK